MKNIILSAVVALVFSLSAAFAADGSVVLVKGSKSYQTRVISPSVEKQEEVAAPAQVDPVSIEPAAGAEKKDSGIVKSDTTHMLRQSMKLPRKN